ncbi:MAG: S1C family serine protease [Desulfovibrio sp.]|uniref:S1C family serine protease n=1 Tax=Desulfovibrio sp. 7SRBS1 TaxID=3378064 RepID=UPI003B3E8B67
MRNRALLFLLCCVLLCTACGKSHYATEQGVDLNAYKYVVVADRNDDLMLAMELERMFGGMGFEVISVYRADALPMKERSKVLVLNSRTIAMEWEARAQVRLLDYVDKRVIYRGEAEYGGGFLEPRDQAVEAVRKALGGVFELYQGYSPEAQKSKDRLLAGEWENIDRSRQDLERYFDEHLGTLDKVEGIWTSWDDACQVAVFSSFVPDKRDFVGIVLSSDLPAWQPGDVMLNFKRTAYDNAYTGKMAWADKAVTGGTFIINKYGVLEFRSTDPYSGRGTATRFIRIYPRDFDNEDGTTPAVSGSGFLLDGSGIVVTNNHVVEKKGRIKVRFSTLDKTFTARVAARDVRNDLALLRLENAGPALSGLGTPPFGFARPGEVRVGQELMTAGFPLPSSLGGSCKLTTGVVSALSGPSDEPNTMQVTNPIQPGNSGGAAINRQGNVVGVVVSSLNSKLFLNRLGVVPQNVNYCVKVEYLRALAAMVPGATQAMQRRADLSALSLEQLFDRVVPYMVQILVYTGKNKEDGPRMSNMPRMPRMSGSRNKAAMEPDLRRASDQPGLENISNGVDVPGNPAEKSPRDSEIMDGFPIPQDGGFQEGRSLRAPSLF